jgi:hypothetical protein
MSAVDRADALPAALQGVLGALADRQTCAAVLAVLARITGDERYSRAAGALRGKLGGRREIDDADQLSLIEAMLKDGTVRTVEEAARYVGRDPSEHNPETAAKRLARKYRDLHKSETRRMPV